jgi:hypothetical protein
VDQASEGHHRNPAAPTTVGVGAALAVDHRALTCNRWPGESRAARDNSEGMPYENPRRYRARK